MQQTQTEIGSKAEERQTLALIGAMKDGMVDSFDFRGMKVRRRAGSMAVSRHHNSPVLGGMFHLKNPSVAELYEWLEEKADFYGDNR